MLSVKRLNCILVLLVSHMVATSGYALTTTHDVDFGMTGQLMESWSSRRSFPDTTTLAYHQVFGHQTLFGGLTPDARRRVIEFIKKSQRADGGFVDSPSDAGKTRLIYTYYALRTLQLVKATDSIDHSGAARFIESLVIPGGAIAPSLDERKEASLASTYYGVAALQILGKLEILKRNEVIGYVMNHRGADGGFSVMPGGTSSPRGVAMAVDTLAALDGLKEDVGNGAVAYLEETMAIAGYKGMRHRAFSTMQAAVDTLSALSTMQALKTVDTEQIQAFVMSLYIPVNGGFGPMPGYGTTPPSTLQGIYCLKLLDKLPALKDR